MAGPNISFYGLVAISRTVLPITLGDRSSSSQLLQLIEVSATRGTRASSSVRKTPLRLKEIWAIRIRLQLAERTRELALFNLTLDSKLRSCDLVKLRVCDISPGEHIAARAIVMQQKTQRPVQFEITEQTRESIAKWMRSWGWCSVITHSRVACDRLHICRQGSTRGLSANGYGKSASTLRHMAPILCGEQGRR